MRGRPAIPKGRRPTRRAVQQGRQVIEPNKGTLVSKRCNQFSWETGRCKAWQAKGTEYCIGHARQRGLIDNGAAV